LLTQIKRDNIKNANWVRIGILFNITGNAVTILMIVLDRYGIKNVFTTDYPLFFMRCGILADTVFYLIAILKKWQWQEKELAMQQIEKKLAIEKVRNQISSRLHDDIGSTLSGVSMYSYLANDLLVRGNHIEAKKSLTIIKSSVDEMVEKLGDLVWSVNKEEDSLPLLINRLEEYGVNLCSVKNITFKKSGVVNNFDLSAEQRYHLYLFCKEALNNAVKYSEAALLQLRVIEIDHQLEISISDNGKGFDIHSVRRGNGLDNMEKRAQEIGADFNIKSKIGEGCEILLKVKIT
jgi:signal transduction histidine kinase